MQTEMQRDFARGWLFSFNKKILFWVNTFLFEPFGSASIYSNIIKYTVIYSRIIRSLQEKAQFKICYLATFLSIIF